VPSQAEPVVGQNSTRPTFQLYVTLLHPDQLKLRASFPGLGLLIAKAFRPGDIFGEQQVKGAPLFGAAKRPLTARTARRKFPLKEWPGFRKSSL
jgi:hypothetical protein